eukprot:Selendium_serpulae@DN6491_c1_g1_i1.p1
MAAKLDLISQSASYLSLGPKPPVPSTSAASVAHLKVLERADEGLEPDAAPLGEAVEAPPLGEAKAAAREEPRRVEAEAPPRPKTKVVYRDFAAEDRAPPTSGTLDWKPVMVCMVSGIVLFALCFYFAASLAASDSNRLKRQRRSRRQAESDSEDEKAGRR